MNEAKDGRCDLLTSPRPWIACDSVWSGMCLSYGPVNRESEQHGRTQPLHIGYNVHYVHARPAVLSNQELRDSFIRDEGQVYHEHKLLGCKCGNGGLLAPDPFNEASPARIDLASMCQDDSGFVSRNEAMPTEIMRMDYDLVGGTVLPAKPKIKLQSGNEIDMATVARSQQARPANATDEGGDLAARGDVVVIDIV